MNVVAVLAGVAAMIIGALGVSGRLDNSSVALYRRFPGQPAPTARGQRLGGATLVVGGAVFVVFGILRLTGAV